MVLTCCYAVKSILSGFYHVAKGFCMVVMCCNPVSKVLRVIFYVIVKVF